MESVTGSGADEEKNRRDEDGVGEGAVEEQENQAVRRDGSRSRGRRRSVRLHFPLDARARSIPLMRWPLVFDSR